MTTALRYDIEKWPPDLADCRWRGEFRPDEKYEPGDVIYDEESTRYEGGEGIFYQVALRHYADDEWLLPDGVEWEDVSKSWALKVRRWSASREALRSIDRIRLSPLVTGSVR